MDFQILIASKNKTALIKRFLFMVLFFVTANMFSQTHFEAGYYIDNLDKKVNCLIKNTDWKNNPTEFKYKLNENDEIKVATIDDIKEFVIYNFAKYIRATVGVDRSSRDALGISKQKKSLFTEETLFLQTILEGKASLYKFEDKSLKYFFFSVDDEPLEQLVYKKYYLTKNGAIDKYQILDNNTYRNQLWMSLKCASISKSQFENLKYRSNALEALFKKYNTCNNAENIEYKKVTNKKLFNFTLTPGLDVSSYKQQIATGRTSVLDVNFGYQSSLRLGAELEAILPFNNNKWAIIVEPFYQSYKSESEVDDEQIDNARFTYSSLGLNFAFRHYFFISDKAKLFINAGYAREFKLNLEIEIGDATEEALINKSAGAPIIGMGFKIKNRYSVELRSVFNRELVRRGLNLSDSKYNTFSLILGYTIF